MFAKIKNAYTNKKEIIDIVFFSTISFFITFFVFAYIFTKNNLYPFGEYSIAWCDLKQQGIPLLMNLKDALEGNGSLLYSFNNASGMNFWGVFLFFLSNPFSFLCVFFEKAELYKLVIAFTVLKLCLSSFFATFVMGKIFKNTQKGITVALGISYGLCAYGLMYYQNVMWLDLMYLYPLLILGIYNIINKKGYFLYTVILALCVIFNFYLSFMVIISVLIIIGLYFIFYYKKEDNKKIALDFFKGSAVAAFMSAISWLPAFIQYSASGRGESLIETLSSSAWNTSQNTIFLLLLSSAVLIIGVFSFFNPSKSRMMIFSAFALFVIPIFVEPVNKMWHTGSYMSFPGRYAFITIFFGLMLVAMALEEKPATSNEITDLISHKDFNANEEKSLNKDFNATIRTPENKDLNATTKIPENKNSNATTKTPENNSFSAKITSFFKELKPINLLLVTVSILITIITVYLLCTRISFETFETYKNDLFKFTKTLWGDEKELEITWRVAKIFGVVYFIYALMFKIKAFPKKIFSLLLVGVVVCEGIFAINVYAVTVKDKNVFNGYENFLDLEGKITDEGFYRIKTEKKYQDSNLLGALGYNSIGHYTSLTNQEYMNTSKALGYSSSWMELSTYGGTELSDAILGIRYKVVNKKIENSVYTNGSYSIIDNFASLGLGVKYSGEKDVFSYDQCSRTDFQEKIFASLFQSEEKLFEKYEPSLFDKCSLKTKDGRTEIQGKGQIIYNIYVEGEQSLYFDAFGEFSNNLRQSINKGFDVYVNGRKVATYPDGMYTGFVNLGIFKDEEAEIRIVTKKSFVSMFSFGISGLKRQVLKNALETAESGFLNAYDNKVFGTVEGKDGEFLFISVPFDKGFKVLVNGEKITPKKVFGDFYSIPLKEGENEILMKYTPPGFVLGLFGTIIGIALFVLLIVIEKKKKTNKCVLEKVKGIFVSLFLLLFAGVFFGIYIFPVLVKLF